MGRRPALLSETLHSLAPLLSKIPVLAVNDFGDEESNEVFRRYCPHGCIVNPAARMGHHRAVDLMYNAVETDYVFHFEDDWHFDRCDFVEECQDLLTELPMASAICVRSASDFLEETQLSDIPTFSATSGTRYMRLDGIHAEWYGYTFNPHIAPKATWTNVGGFSGFRKERHISRTLRTKDRFVPYLASGACRHIGQSDSVTRSRPTFTRKLKDMLGL